MHSRTYALHVEPTQYIEPMHFMHCSTHREQLCLHNARESRREGLLFGLGCPAQHPFIAQAIVCEWYGTRCVVYGEYGEYMGAVECASARSVQEGC
jgi:hypothetical protein